MRRTALVVLAGVLLPVAVAAPAAAAGAITAPSAGTTVESHAGVEVRARVTARSADTELRLRDPLGVARTVATSPMSLQERTLSYVFDTSCPDYPGAPCSGSAPVRNGTWVLELAGGATDRRELVVRVPPRVPTGLEGRATGPREVLLTWRRGAEPDLTGYVVVDGEGREVSEVGLGACETPTCRHLVAYGSDGPSTEVLAVRARRSACPDCTARLTSGPSSTVTVSRPAAPVSPEQEPVPAEPVPGATPEPRPSGPSASPSASPRPSTGPLRLSSTAGPAPAGGTGRTSGGSLGLGAGSRLPLLPPLTGSVDAPVVAPLDDTTFLPELPFGEGSADLAPQAAPEPVLPVTAAPRAPGVDLVDEEQAARALAASLVLLLGAAHAQLRLRSR